MRDLRQSIEIAAPIEAVWAEITKLHGVQRALMDTVLETSFEPGDPLYYKSRDGKRTFIVGRIVEVRPPELLAHTQVLTTRDYAPTLVTWGLSADGVWRDEGDRRTHRMAGRGQGRRFGRLDLGLDPARAEERARDPDPSRPRLPSSTA